MIGREQDLQPFELIRWARSSTRRYGLSPIDAHVLLVLATYANEQGMAWPSIPTIARDIGLVVSRNGRCSTVSASLARLTELRLIWPRGGGNGRPTRRELLHNPSSTQDESPVLGNGRHPSSTQDVPRPTARTPTRPSARTAPVLQPGHEVPENYQGEEPKKSQRELPGTAVALRGRLSTPRKCLSPHPLNLEAIVNAA